VTINELSMRKEKESRLNTWKKIPVLLGSCPFVYERKKFRKKIGIDKIYLFRTSS